MTVVFKLGDTLPAIDRNKRQSKVLANERIRYICKVLSHWLKPWSAIGRFMVSNYAQLNMEVYDTCFIWIIQIPEHFQILTKSHRNIALSIYRDHFSLCNSRRNAHLYPTYGVSSRDCNSDQNFIIVSVVHYHIIYNRDISRVCSTLLLLTEAQTNRRSFLKTFWKVFSWIENIAVWFIFQYTFSYSPYWQ